MSDAAGARTHLIFGLAEEHYATPVTEVEEVLEWQPVTVVPRCPEYLLGIINVRGSLIPVLDLRLRFGMTTGDGTILVVRMTHGAERIQMGLVVDAVEGVVDIPADDLEPPPAIGQGIDTAAIDGVARHGERLLLVVNADAILTREQLDADFDALDAMRNDR